MTSNGWFLVSMLALLFLANLGMLMGMTNWPQRTRENFVARFGTDSASLIGSPSSGLAPFTESESLAQGASYLQAQEQVRGQGQSIEGFVSNPGNQGSVAPLPPKERHICYTTFPNGKKKPAECFTDYLVDGGFGTAPMGSFDGLDLAAGLPPASQGFRARMPNVPHPPGTTMLPFVNNECKPECCGSTMSCDGGCVCTTPEDRNLINTRGGNRSHDDGL